MKRTLLILIAGSALSLSAQQGTAWVTGHVGETLFGSDAKVGGFAMKDQIHFGLGVGHWYTNKWGLDLRAIRNDLTLETPGAGTGKQTHALLSGLYNLRPSTDNWTPYLAAGVGATNVGTPYSTKGESTTRFNYHAGLGVQAKPADNFLLDMGVKAVRVELASRRTEYLVSLGFGYAWGSGKAAPAPVSAPAPKAVPAPAPAPAPAPKPAPEPVAPAPPPPPARIVLDEAVLHFANNKAELGPEAIAAIQKVAGGLKAYKGDYTLTVSGHTSSLGGKALNKALAKQRADAVAKILVDAGIPAARVSTVGVGPDQPLADNATKAGQAKNRRVEIDVKVSDGKAEVRKTVTGVVEGPAPK
jgi:OOP family OmpA-OmpF porin